MVVHVWGSEWSLAWSKDWMSINYYLLSSILRSTPECVLMCVLSHTHTHTHTHTQFDLQLARCHSLFIGNKLRFSGPRPLSYESFDYEPNGPSKTFKLLNVIFNFQPFACCGSSLKKKTVKKKSLKKIPPTCNRYTIEGLN